MDILFISDIFINFHEAVKSDVEVISWKDSQSISLGDYDSVIFDITFGDREIPSNFGNVLYEFKKKLGKPNYISKNNIILIFICGEKYTEFSRDDDDYENAYNDEPIKISNYDILEDIVFEFRDNVEYEKGKSRFSLATVPVHIYFDRYKNSATHLNYGYDHISNIHKFNIIKPLARMKESDSPCVAFECSQGKGSVIILPSYDIFDSKNAFSLLITISKSYIKRKQGIMELNNIDKKIKEQTRESFIEAISCFHNDLYSASLLMCRRVLEESITELYAKQNNNTLDETDVDQKQKKIVFLRKKIEELHKKGIIPLEMKKRAFSIITFGNWPAHPDISNEKVTENDARMTIEFLKKFLDYFIVYPQKGDELQERITELHI